MIFYKNTLTWLNFNTFCDKIVYCAEWVIIYTIKIINIYF